MPDAVLVQGASRGLGLAFVKRLIGQFPSSKIIATCRDPNSALALQELVELHPQRVTLLRLDVTDGDSLEAVAEAVSVSGKPIDLLINCAGVLHSPEGLRPEKRLQDVCLSNLEQYFRVNTIGPLMVAKHLVLSLIHI